MIKYYTVAYEVDFPLVKQKIQFEIGALSKLQKVGSLQSLMGNYRIQEFRVHLNPGLIVKIEGPERILLKFFKEYNL